MAWRAAVAAALALAGCAQPLPLSQGGLLRIEGRLEGPAPGSLGVPAQWVVELRDAEGERVLAEQRGTVAAGQPPIPFVLTHEAAAAAAQRYTLRAALQLQGQVRWLSEPRAIEAPAARLDIGSLQLLPYTHPGGFANTLDCGGQRVTVGYLGEQLRLSVGTRVYDLAAVRGSTPPRFERAEDPSTFVQLDERGAMVSLRGRLLARCIGQR